MLQRFALLGAILGLIATGCSPQPVSPPSADATASPTAAPIATSSPGLPSASPTATPSAAPAFSLEKGVILSGYKPVDPVGVFYDPGLGNLYVADAVDTTSFPVRYNLQRLSRDGVPTSSSNLTPENGKAPTAVDGVAFDLSANPVVATREGDAFGLYKVVTANVLLGDRFPIFQLPRVGITGTSSLNGIVTTAALAFDPTKTDKVDGQINYGRGQDDKVPLALFRIPDPFNPTARMAIAPSGNVYLAGPTRENKLLIKKLAADRSLTDLPAQISSIPDGMWVGPDERIYLVWNQGGSPATVRRVNVEGKIDAESQVKLQAGGFISYVRGIAVDDRGALIIVGTGYDAENVAIKALVKFSE